MLSRCVDLPLPTRELCTPAHPGCTKCTKCTISAPPPFLDIKSPVYLPGAGGGREGGVPGHPPGAPPCTRSCERLGSKAPKNTLFRGLSTPPGPPPPGIPGGEKPPFFTPFHPHPPTPPTPWGTGVRGGARGCAGGCADAREVIVYYYELG